jgi:glycosyltransferase involved in cell wall biosynthesis
MVQKPTVAVYLRLLYGGGAERAMVSLMHGFVQQGWHVELVMNTASGPYLSEIPDTVKVVDLQAPRMLAGLPKLVQYLRSNRPDFLISSLHYSNEVAIVACMLAGTSTKVFVVEQNTLSIHSEERKTDRWAPGLSKLLYPRADGVIAVSRGVTDDLRHTVGLSGDRLRTIYNPAIFPKLFTQAQVAVDHEWIQAADLPIVLGAGRLEKQKDFATLIHAFAKVLQTREARLIILGTGQQRQHLQDLINSLGIADKARLQGYVKNPYPYFARASVFALSSRWEGFGNVLAEALALGTPVVSTDCPNGPAEILDGGRYGALVNMGDSNAMAEAILAAIAGKLQQPDHAWLSQFSLDTVTSQYMELMTTAA